MILNQLYESVPSPEQKEVLDSVVSTVKKAEADTDVHLHRADYGDWIVIKIGDNSCAFKIEKKVLHLADMYLPKSLQGKGLMTEILKNLKSKLGSKLNGECKVHVPMNPAGWQKIVERAGFKWIAPISREDFLKQLAAAK